MEFISQEFPEIKIYYRFKKLTKNQNEFLTSMLHNLVNNRLAIYEFAPTLDKDFLYNSILFSLSRYKNEKFIILTKNYDKIYELMKNFALISNLCKKYNNDFDKLKVVPFFDRKMMCINNDALENASSIDLDSYCTQITASWLDENSKCVFYNVKSHNKKFRIIIKIY
jgi:hypothetical protein